MFVDERGIKVKAGAGGDGVVHWRREKFIANGGPDGGNGGKGGDIYIESTRNLSTLGKYSENQTFVAESGGNGEGGLRSGKSAKDLRILVPISTRIINKDTGEEFYLTKEKQSALIAAGGDGGFGNAHFKSSRMTTPKIATKGIGGQEYSIIFNLELIADVGLIGIPSAGKSSILNAITNTRVKTAEYHFTTLEPNLGIFHGFVIADIPGLIEGASSGRGLGIKFLKHIYKTTFLIHCLSLENDFDTIVNTYEVIRKELGNFDKSLLDKKEIILLTKKDVVENAEETKRKVEQSFGKHKQVLLFSIIEDDVIEEFSQTLSRILNQEIDKLSI